MIDAISVASAPVPAGPYSHAMRAGDFVFVSGQVPRSADGTYEPADVGTETRRTLVNLTRIVEAAGGTLGNVVKVTVYLADGVYFADFNAAYAEFFDDHRPARTTVIVGLREVKVEVDAVVYLDSGQ